MANEEQILKEATETVEEVNQNEDVQVDMEQQEATMEKDDLTIANEKIADLEAKLADSENRLFRLQADFENYKRRIRLDQEAASKYRAQSLVTDLLPALDNFERAMKVEAKDEGTKSLLQGMDMVYRSLVDALSKEGVETIESVGSQFDPHLHQAVMQVEEADAEPNVVLEEFQKGYKLKDRVIRPTMVKVNQS
ncbi:nucleotide exchange factor GrpE [Litchfieldia alkalitelluris]|uniref:nucleotide exchange factor GrpE n=1 Tax=Litchfieldia alkalitelluris TaxID=304268 RepID=UPI00099807E0|nr:nucleotide exchange factor GrpE [Litchfieldia alkalitelluris]